MGEPAAVLIRAVEPLDRRGRDAGRADPARDPGDRWSASERARIGSRLDRLDPARLAAGPGLVAAAFDITRADTGADLLDARRVAADRARSGAEPRRWRRRGSGSAMPRSPGAACPGG